jgi:hypothetical protein
MSWRWECGGSATAPLEQASVKPIIRIVPQQNDEQRRHGTDSKRHKGHRHATAVTQIGFVLIDVLPFLTPTTRMAGGEQDVATSATSPVRLSHPTFAYSLSLQQASSLLSGLAASGVTLVSVVVVELSQLRRGPSSFVSLCIHSLH